MTAYDAARWSDFSLGQLGASAALLGLVFVGLSINLQHLIRSPQLVNRGGAVVVLGSVLAAASVVIIPDQDRTTLGIELLAVAVATFASVALLQRGAGASADEGDGAPRGSLPFRRALALADRSSRPSLAARSWPAMAAACSGGPPRSSCRTPARSPNVWVLLIEILR
ncbi:MAG TPA: hypothetical protein VI462_09270 [Acidimicrobiia bacterium]